MAHRENQHLSNLLQKPKSIGQNVMNEALRLLADGATEVEAAAILNVPQGSIQHWERADPAFAAAYAYARRAGAAVLASETVSIADDSDGTREAFNRDRLRIQTRQWLAARHDPDTYGDRTNVNLGGSVEVRRTAFKSFLGEREAVVVEATVREASEAGRGASSEGTDDERATASEAEG